jgi:hypothetical protein
VSDTGRKNTRDTVQTAPSRERGDGGWLHSPARHASAQHVPPIKDPRLLFEQCASDLLVVFGTADHPASPPVSPPAWLFEGQGVVWETAQGRSQERSSYSSGKRKTY